MNHNTLVIEIKSTLDKLIAARTSLGYDYIVYGLLLINEDQTRVSNITKALYIDIAAHYETSWSCVEKNIRNTVNAIWTAENKTILEMIFNRTHMDRKPTNKEFFEYLYDFTITFGANVGSSSVAGSVTSSVVASGSMPSLIVTYVVNSCSTALPFVSFAVTFKITG